MVTDEHFQRAAQVGGAAYAGNKLQINEAANKKAVNCSLLQPTANACDTENGRTWSLCDYDNLINNNILRHSENSSGTECVTLPENTVLSPDDQQALKTIISIWPYLSPESKIEVMRTIEAANRSQPATGSAMS